jgi:hypothetical protein
MRLYVDFLHSICKIWALHGWLGVLMRASVFMKWLGMGAGVGVGANECFCRCYSLSPLLSIYLCDCMSEYIYVRLSSPRLLPQKQKLTLTLTLSL